MEKQKLRDTLTKRELEVFELIRTGLLQKEVADILNISQRTVETYTENIREKTNSNNMIEAIYKLTNDEKT